jgi:hypothetical protein
MSLPETPCISISMRDYVDLRIASLQKERRLALKVQDEKRAALEVASDLRIKHIEDQLRGYRAQALAFIFAVLLILVDIYLRK